MDQHKYVQAIRTLVVRLRQPDGWTAHTAWLAQLHREWCERGWPLEEDAAGEALVAAFFRALPAPADPPTAADAVED